MTRFILETILFSCIGLHATTHAFTTLPWNGRISGALALNLARKTNPDENAAILKTKLRSTIDPMGKDKTHRAGLWLPEDPTAIGRFLDCLRNRVHAVNPDQSTLVVAPPVRALDDLVRSDPALYGNAQAMFLETTTNATESPLGTQRVQDWDEFVTLLNYIVQTVAPEFFHTPSCSTDTTGLVAFPIHALLDWPMGTLPGFAVFSNPDFNAAIKDVLTHWTNFLTSPNSTYTLTTSKSSSPSALGWLDPDVRRQLVETVNSAVNNPRNVSEFHHVFDCDPEKPCFGFSSWDSFFTRDFHPHVRPVQDPDDWSKIASACESTPLQVVRNAKLHDQFWLKDQPYSLKHMIDCGPHHNKYAESFAGGTVYQAYLSALSYHQWRSPISGTVVASYKINGTYFLQSYHKGYDDTGSSDPVAPNDSQPYLTSVASRSVIIIESDEAALGRLAFIAVGMSDCGSCETHVQKGDKVAKGDPIGTFHYGGSTHCLVFQPHVNLEFIPYIEDEAGLHATRNIAVSSTIAQVKASRAPVFLREFLKYFLAGMIERAITLCWRRL